MLKGGSNILETPCAQIGKTVPYFKEMTEGTSNQKLYDVFRSFTDSTVSLTKKHLSIDGLEEIPDGVLVVRKSNEKQFEYRMQINDYKYYQYHRNNGVTKIGYVRDDGSNKT